MSTKPNRESWQHGLYAVPDIFALRALERGDATPEQQKRALMWIINVAAATHAETFDPGRPDVSAYLSGRRSVGLQINKLLTMPIDLLKAAAIE